MTRWSGRADQTAIGFVRRVVRAMFSKKATRGIDLFLRETELPQALLAPLKNDSWFFDIGGYKGNCSRGIYDAFACNVVCFEPASSSFMVLQRRFSGLGKIRLERCAVSDEDRMDRLFGGNGADGKSLFAELGGGERSWEDVRVIDIVRYLEENDIRKIDLLKLNCEGSEWAIVGALILSGRILNVGQLVVQWHGSAVSKDRQAEIKELLSRSHKCTKYHTAWELWQPREVAHYVQ